MRRSTLCWLLSGLLLSGVVLAQDEQEGPGRGVARVSLMNGDVSVRRGDSGDWVAAVINAPLLVDDRIQTSGGARAEVQFDYYHRIRLAPDTEIRLAQLEERQYQIQVARGTVTFSALKGGDAQVEVSLPGAAVRPVAYGNYRITVLPDGYSEITLRSGEAEIYSPTGTQRLRPGKTLHVRTIDGNNSEFQLVAAIPRDEWDQFNDSRDRDLSKGAQAYQYVSRDITGAEDLTGQGEWNYVAPYGWSWAPYVAADWAPYRYGRWGWTDWYGWTWISYDPWGWAPYHYGRWFYYGNRWCWYPGAIGVRHYWSPALVGWVGWNSWGGFSAGFGFGWGAVGWVPLAPFEPCYRWWGPRYYTGYRGGVYNNTTIVNNVNVTNIYRNARVDRGVTAVSGSDFSRGFVGRPLRMGGEDLSRANVARGTLPVAPGRESLRFSDRESSVRTNTTSPVQNERFYSRTQAARVDRVPLDQQRRSIENFASRQSGDVRIIGGDGPRSTEGGRATVTPRSAEDTRSGWRQADQPARGDTSRQSGSSEWRRFGDPSVGSRTAEDSRGRGSSTTDNPAVRSLDQNSNSGWRSFGDPSSRSTKTDSTRTDTPRWSTGSGTRGSSDTPRVDSQRADTPRWSTGGTTRSETPRMDSPRNDATRSETPRWSTGGGAARSEAPRSDPSRGSTGGGAAEPSRAAPSTGGGDRSTSGSRGGGRGNSDPEPMARGGWSTGGGASSGQAFGFGDSSRSAPRVSGPSNGGWSSGRSSEMSIPRSAAPSYSAPSYSAPRSGFGGGSTFSAPSPSIGGGMRSGGGFSAPSAPSVGGGMRGGGGFGGGGGRSGGVSGGGGSHGGGGGGHGGGRGR